MSGRLRVMVGAVGLAGHALPAIALARELRARGHEVLFCSYERWRETVEGIGLRFQGGAEQIFDPVAGADGADASRGGGGEGAAAERARVRAQTSSSATDSP